MKIDLQNPKYSDITTSEPIKEVLHRVRRGQGSVLDKLIQEKHSLDLVLGDNVPLDKREEHWKKWTGRGKRKYREKMWTIYYANMGKASLSEYEKAMRDVQVKSHTEKILVRWYNVRKVLDIYNVIDPLAEKEAKILSTLQQRVDLCLSMLGYYNVLVVKDSLIHKELTKLGLTHCTIISTTRVYRSTLGLRRTRDPYMFYGVLAPERLTSAKCEGNTVTHNSLTAAHFSPSHDLDDEGDPVAGKQVFGLEDALLTMTRGEVVRGATKAVTSLLVAVEIERQQELLVFKSTNLKVNEDGKLAELFNL